MSDIYYDLTPSNLTVEELCACEDEDGFVCTRLPDHTGRHAAGNGDQIISVWSDES